MRSTSQRKRRPRAAYPNDRLPSAGLSGPRLLSSCSRGRSLFLRLALGHFLALFAGLGQAECDRLFPTFYLTAFSAFSTLQRPRLALVHRFFDVLRRCLRIFSCHCSLLIGLRRDAVLVGGPRLLPDLQP